MSAGEEDVREVVVMVATSSRRRHSDVAGAFRVYNASPPSVQHNPHFLPWLPVAEEKQTEQQQSPPVSSQGKRSPGRPDLCQPLELQSDSLSRSPSFQLCRNLVFPETSCPSKKPVVAAVALSVPLQPLFKTKNVCTGRGRKGGGGYGCDQQSTPSFGSGEGVSEFTTLRIKRCTPPSVQHNPAVSTLALSDEVEHKLNPDPPASLLISRCNQLQWLRRNRQSNSSHQRFLRRARGLRGDQVSAQLEGRLKTKNVCTGRGRKGGGGYGCDQQSKPSFGSGEGVSEFTTLRIKRCTPPSVEYNPAVSTLALSDEVEHKLNPDPPLRCLSAGVTSSSG
ncbi:unnamed protein product [Fraxinus pennsylvanica]|uniref:Uncharacterized protein n=1 Tax=Fraxinus pennsylvanica TaxID=56036 RepID=A0AAD2EA19_9LAMI|nr:unnamed protein product [Fraxinus pennsylvanica]